MRPVRAVSLLLPVAALGSLLLSRGAHTLPLYAARTGNMCAQCHFDPNGGGPRNDFGFMFARNRHSLETDTTGAWKDLNLTNRIGDAMPVYIGLNQRFMLLANTSSKSDSLDRFGFFNMENAIHITFKPHERLTLVYSRDAFSVDVGGGVAQTEAFGMLGIGGNSYLKLGRFRTPFGLRMDDHTVATRNGFLDFSTGTGFLPYDPRYPDMGVEYGTTWGSYFARAAFTNGDADLFLGEYAETKTVKIGHVLPFYQGGLSFYDDYHKNPGAARKRATRWGYYGLGHLKELAVIGEVAAGTDEAATGAKRNLLAGFIEADYAPGRTVNVRVRYDYLNTDRASNDALRDANTHYRYALEGEWVPVPFAELRAAARRIDHKDETAFGHDDENQYFLQAHFSY